MPQDVAPRVNYPSLPALGDKNTLEGHQGQKTFGDKNDREQKNVGKEGNVRGRKNVRGKIR